MARTAARKGAAAVAIGVLFRALVLGLPALAASAVLLAGPIAHADEDRELTAREAFAAGRYQEALDIYAKLFAETLHPTYLRNVGRCQQMLGEADQAIKTFHEYLRRVPDLAPQKRAEIEGFIAEMEALKKTREQAADHAAAPPTASTAQSSGPAAGGPLTVEARPAPPPEAGTEASSHRGQLGVLVRGDAGVYPNLGLVIVPGLSFGLSHHLDIEAGALVGRYKGGWAGVRFFFATGEIKPLASLEIPVFSASGSLTAGIKPGAGLQWDPDRHFGLFAAMTVSYFPGANKDLKALWVVPLLGVQGRL